MIWCDRCKWWPAGVRTNNQPKRLTTTKNEGKKTKARMCSTLSFLFASHISDVKSEKKWLSIESYTLSAMLLSTSEWMITIQGVSKFNSISRAVHLFHLVTLFTFTTHDWVCVCVCAFVFVWQDPNAATKTRSTIRKQNEKGRDKEKKTTT